MSGKFLTQKGMAEVRHAINVTNSVIKRKKIKGYSVGVICGCSRGCGLAYIQEQKPNSTVVR